MRLIFKRNRISRIFYPHSDGSIWALSLPPSSLVWSGFAPSGSFLRCYAYSSLCSHRGHSQGGRTLSLPCILGIPVHSTYHPFPKASAVKGEVEHPPSPSHTVATLSPQSTLWWPFSFKGFLGKILELQQGRHVAYLHLPRNAWVSNSKRPLAFLIISSVFMTH